MNKKINILFLIGFTILCGLVLFNAFHMFTPKILEEKPVNKISWDTKFTKDSSTNKIEVNSSNNLNYELPTLFGTIINDYKVDLINPNDYLEMSFYLTNESNKDAYISNMEYPKVSCKGKTEECNKILDKINYTFKYDNNKDIKINDVIENNTSKKVILKIEYTGSDKIPNNISIYNLGLSLTVSEINN